MRSKLNFFYFLVLACAPTGCADNGNGSAASGGIVAGETGTVGSGGRRGTVVERCHTQEAPRSPLRRLTRFEYNNVVRDLLGIRNRPADLLPGEESGNGFGNDADALGVSRILIDGYHDLAKSISSSVTETREKAGSLTGCGDTPTDENACRDTFIANFGARAFRRPLESRESAALQATFAMGRTDRDFRGGVRAVVERILQSPQFLYRVELGEPDPALPGFARSTDFEMASRLSFLLWGSMPDPPLFEAATRNELRTREQIAAQATRLLADVRARDVTREFHSRWLGILGLSTFERSTFAYPSFKPELGELFRAETEAFVNDVIWNGTGDYQTLLQAPYSFVNETLAEFYQLPGVVGPALRKVSLNAKQRAGLLTQASVLSITTPGSRTNPVVRGKWVYTKMLCGQIPDPPAGIPMEPAVTSGVSTRERLVRHRADPACTSCHRVLDPIGFGLENFNGIGQWRDSENGVTIDAQGEIEDTDATGVFNGPIELAQRIAQSRDAQDCFVGNWLTFAYGRSELAEDECTRMALQEAFAASKGNIRSLLLALTQTELFLYRTLPIATKGAAFP